MTVKLRFSIKSGYYIVPSPSTALHMSSANFRTIRPNMLSLRSRYQFYQYIVPQTNIDAAPPPFPLSSDSCINNNYDPVLSSSIPFSLRLEFTSTGSSQQIPFKIGHYIPTGFCPSSVRSEPLKLEEHTLQCTLLSLN